MKKNKKRLLVAFTLLTAIGYSQKFSQEKVDKLTQTLNSEIAPKIQFKFDGNKGYFNIGKFSKSLDLRNSFQIVKEAKKTQVKPIKPTAETIYWTYNFTKAISSNAEFKANKHQKIFCKISFSELNNIVLETGLSNFSSAHRISDSTPHELTWSGDKYVSLLISPEKINETIKFKVMGITVSGKFERNDNKQLAKNYTKALRKILKREFKKVFESEEMNTLISNKIDANN